jgi:hypothetical protein
MTERNPDGRWAKGNSYGNRSGQPLKSGRPKGAINKGLTNAEIKRLASETGLTSIEYMRAVVRDENASASRRDRMAESLAPYEAPKLSYVESRSETNHRHVVILPAVVRDSQTWLERCKAAAALRAPAEALPKPEEAKPYANEPWTKSE